MKILFLKDKRTPSGIEGSATYLLRLCKVLNKKKIAYLVLYNGKNDTYFKEMKKNHLNIKFFDFPKETPKNFFRFFKILNLRKKIDKLIFKEKITIVNSHFPHLNYFLSKSLKVPLVSHWHGAEVKNIPIKIFDKNNILKLKIRDLFFRIYRKFKVFNFNLANKVIVHGKASKMTAIKMFNVESGKIKINPYGVERYNLKKIKTIHQEFNLPKNVKIILSAGRIVKDKGVEEFCEIAKKLTNKKIKFIFLGHYRDKNYYNKIIEKYSEFVIFPGFRTDIERFYKSSYIFLLLSYRESAGLVLVEAMNFSLPLVGWNIIGVNEIIKNEYNGELIKFRDLKEAMVKINYLLNYKKKYLRMSKNSLKSFNNYKIESSAYKLIKIFDKIEKYK